MKGRYGMRERLIRHNLVFHSSDFGEQILRDGAIDAKSTIDLTTRSHKATDLRHDATHHETKGICITRSFHFAKAFSTSSSAIFGLDVGALRCRFRIIPRAESGAYDLADTHGDYRIEAEEFVICPGVDLGRYCSAIWVHADRRDDADYGDLIGDRRFAGFFRNP